MAWTAALSGIYFLIIMKLGHFRIDKSVEVIGLDIAEMGGLSSNLFDKILKDNFSRKNSAFMSPSQMSPSQRTHSQLDTLIKNVNASLEISNNRGVEEALKMKGQMSGVSAEEA